MLELVATNPAPDATEEEDFEVLVDEPYITVLRENGVYVCQVHTPCNLGDITMELGSWGYVVMDVYGEEGVLEMLLRPLGDIPVDDVVTQKRAAIMRDLVQEREMAYA